MEFLQKVHDTSASVFLYDFKLDSPEMCLDTAQFFIDQLPLGQIDSPLLNLASDSDEVLSLADDSISSLEEIQPIPYETSPRIRHYLESTKPETSFPLPPIKSEPAKAWCLVCEQNSCEIIDGVYFCSQCIKADKTVQTSDESSQTKSKAVTPHPKKGGGKLCSPALKFPPCSVCSGKASGLHYGINSCEACKGFFRRYLLRNEEYRCSKGGNCAITNRSRGNCSGCRLAKCLSLGMSKCASKLGRYTLSQRTKTIMEVKELENRVCDSERSPGSYVVDTEDSQSGRSKIKVVGTTGPRGSPRRHVPKSYSSESSHSWTKDHESLLQILMNAMIHIKPYGEILTEDEIYDKMKKHYEKYSLKVEIFGKMDAIPEDEYYAFLKNYGIDLDGRWAVLKRSKHELEGIIARYVSFAKQVPGFSSLPTDDQSNLLKVSRCDFFMILMHRGYAPEFEVFLAHNGQPFHMDEAADRFFSRGLISSILDIYGKWQKLNLQKEEIPILMALSLTFPDRCKLENRAQVENMQKLMVENLWNLLLKLCPVTAAKRFSKMIDCFLSLRDISEQYFKEYKKLCRNDLIIEEVPMMMEFFLEDW